MTGGNCRGETLVRFVSPVPIQAGKSVIVLGMDTAMQVCSVAIRADDRVLAARHVAQARGHAEALMPMIAAICAEAGLGIKDLDRIGVTVGPGTFTGQRVGLAAARAMVLGTRADLIGVTTLQAVAAGVESVRPGDWIASVFDARRGEVYVQGFTADLAALAAPAVMTPDQAAAHLAALRPPAAGRCQLVGSGGALVAARLAALGLAVDRAPAPDQPDARQVAALAARAPAPEGVPRPLYLRAPDAKLPAGA